MSNNNGENPYVPRETPKTTSDEDYFVKRLLDFHSIVCYKMPNSFILDFFMIGGGLKHGKAVAEFKQRDMDTINQYDDVGGIFINEKKITKMKTFHKMYNLSGYIFIGINNGEYYQCRIDDLDFKIGGSSFPLKKNDISIDCSENLYGGVNKGGERDKQLTFTIPSRYFKNIR